MTLVRSERLAKGPLLVITIALSSALLSGPAIGGGADDGAAPGMVAFFDSDTGACPDGWAPAEYAMGRLVVNVLEEKQVGKQVGKPLGDAEDRTHQHPFATKVELPLKEVAGADGNNNQGAAAQMYDLSASTDPSPSGLPFIQLLACEKL